MREIPPRGDEEVKLSDAERASLAKRTGADAEAIAQGANPTQDGRAFTRDQVEQARGEMSADLASRPAPKAEAPAAGQKEKGGFERVEGIDGVMEAVGKMGAQVRVPNDMERVRHNLDSGRNLLYYLQLPEGARYSGYDKSGRPTGEAPIGGQEITVDDGTQKLTLEEVSPGSGLFRVTSDNKSGTKDVLEFAGTVPAGESGTVSRLEGGATFTIGAVNRTDVIRELKEIAGQSISTLEQRMRPGTDSQAGFLGRNESLTAVLAQDNDYVLRQGLTHQDIAEPLAFAVEQGKKRATEFEYQGAKYKIDARWTRGLQESPFNDGEMGSGDLTITNVETGASIQLGDILPGMVKKYGFYEGRGTSYRTEPAKVVEVFPHLKKKGQDKLARQAQESGR